MNILVIGNGFDLAHGLPTKYGDFLEFVKVIRQVVKKRNGESLSDLEWGNINWKIKELIINSKKDGNKGIFSQERMCDELLNQNFWIDYFLQCDMYQKENWIDFESEISRVIRSIDDDMRTGKFKENTFVTKCTEPYLFNYLLDDYELIERAVESKAQEEIEKIEKSEGKEWNVSQISEYMTQYKKEHPIEDLKEKITYEQVIQRLEDDLNKLDRALEIYLVDYVGNIADVNRMSEFDNLNPDHVLSFNYSDTYDRLYDNKKEIEYDYIHGKADKNNTVESNNMVLGIDEYLENDRKDKDIEFIAFKKFYQRIYKGTSSKYRNWTFNIKESAKLKEQKLRTEYPIQIPFNYFAESQKHFLYIFGHSLDVTDKDVLRELILNDNVYTTIYCLDKKDLKRKIANLVKVIGQEELIRRTGGSTKTIEFKLQQEMVEV